MRIGHLCFSASIPSTVAVLLLLPVLTGLGLWQWDRAGQKRELEALYEQHAHDAPIRLVQHVSDPLALRYRAVELNGRFDPAHTFLLDNRVYRGRAGYEVLTPFRVWPSGLWVLVNRGWVPQGMSRQDLPAIATPRTEVELSGRLNLPPGKTLRLGEEEEPDTPQVIQEVDLARLSARVGASLEPVMVWLDAGSAYGFVRDWQPVPPGAERHLAYAVQWFAMAAALLVIYFAINTRRAGREAGTGTEAGTLQKGEPT